MTKITEKKNRLKSLTRQVNNLQKEIDSHKRKVRANILSGQNEARKSGKKIGRPKECNVLRVNIGISMIETHHYSISKSAKEEKIPYHTLYYYFKKYQKERNVSKSGPVVINNK